MAQPTDLPATAVTGIPAAVQPLAGGGTVRALPIQVRPLSTDTIDSYIRRLAHANHLNPTHLHGYLCQPSGYRNRPRLDRLAAVSGRPLPALQHALSDLRCAECGKPQPLPADTGRPARWCSKRCRAAAYRARRKMADSPRQDR